LSIWVTDLYMHEALYTKKGTLEKFDAIWSVWDNSDEGMRPRGRFHGEGEVTCGKLKIQ